MLDIVAIAILYVMILYVMINYTYHQGEKCSYIDHVIIPEYFSENITECRILSNAQDNVSDHMAISITFSLQIHYPLGKNIHRKEYLFPRARWTDPDFLCHYTKAITKAMEDIPVVEMSKITKSKARDTVNTIYSQLCDTMHNCVGSYNSSYNRPMKRRKYWWSSKCTAARDRNRLFHKIRKSNGRPKKGPTKTHENHIDMSVEVQSTLKTKMLRILLTNFTMKGSLPSSGTF